MLPKLVFGFRTEITFMRYNHMIWHSTHFTQTTSSRCQTIKIFLLIFKVYFKTAFAVAIISFADNFNYHLVPSISAKNSIFRKKYKPS